MEETEQMRLPEGEVEMENIPESLLNSLKKVRDLNEKKLILIRHTDRETIPPGTAGNAAHITLDGKEKAFQLGRNLRSLPIEWCKTSPLIRCTQTINSISFGYGRSIVQSSSTLLGDPGPFVFDDSLASNAFLDHGTEILIRGMITGQTFPGIRSSSEGSEILLRGLIKAFEENTGNGICISHDVIIMPFIAHYCNEHFHEQWLPPLGGVVLSECDNVYTIWWNGDMHRVIL